MIFSALSAGDIAADILLDERIYRQPAHRLRAIPQFLI
jgi:hypothetical protein